MADESAGVNVDSPPRKPKKKSRVLDVVAVAVMLFAVAFAVYHRVPKFRTLTLALAGRSPVCSFGQALNSPEMVREHYERIDRVRSASRLVEEDAEGFELWETPQGKFWVPSGAAETMVWVVAKHQSDMYDPPNLSVHPGDVVLDCGAHVGVFAREALAAGAELVVAIEPAPRTLVALKRNLADEIAAGRVIVYEKGVWNKEETMVFYSDADSALSRVMHPHEDHNLGAEVSLTTIDKIVEELQLERVDFIKMDIEGAEQKALAGARNTLVKGKPRLAVAGYHLEDDQTKIPEIVLATRPDYDMRWGLCSEKDYRIVPAILYFQ